MHVVATAGHVDHGKSTLVLALTGTDPDRWAEEKARGLTIDLGFAHLRLPSGGEVALVDVPGHVRFLRNMLAGVGAVDAALFVVAASEGWKPQSEEHLRILELLGVDRAVVALTKVAVVDDDTRTLARLELDERLAASTLAGSEVIEVDAPAGVGLDDLLAAVDRMVAAAPTALDRGRPRLWVDRSFVARGSGTVVTGTLAGGSLAVDDELEAVGPGAAAARRARLRVRALQTHGESRLSVGPGHRVAVNVTGASHADLLRGDALVRPGQWHLTRTVDVSLRVLDGLDHTVSRRGAYRLYAGSGEYTVRLRILGPVSRSGLGPAARSGDGPVSRSGDGPEGRSGPVSRSEGRSEGRSEPGGLEPGALGLARLYLPVALALLPGDRFVLRESGRGETVGGGEVLDVEPLLNASRARPDRSVDRVVAERGWVEAAHLARLTGEQRSPDVGGRWVVDPVVLERVSAELRTAIAEGGPAGVELAALDERRRAVAANLDGVVIRAGRAVLAGAAGGAEGSAVSAAGRAWRDDLRSRPWAAPGPAAAGVGRDALRELVREGAVVEREGLWFAAETIATAAAVVADLLAASPDGVTVAAVRDALGASRKHTVPLLAHLDASGVTRRRGDLRIAGPRLPTAGSRVVGGAPA
ncbi:MAG TPA: SelB C-terminal domain-containing protein [Acidimicrobiales bacterium]|jgi:selenocysteine-specific elongation factor|nr:SelB C-terminal domain-containing protein [Acidimicrobiales bacterium]